MLARFAKTMMVAALVAMTGGQWALLQSVAWTTMLADNLSRGSVTEAFSRTFDGKHPCPICKAIAAGKKSERKKDSIPQLQKFEFPLAQEHPLLTDLVRFDTPPPSVAFPKSQIQKPPVPPPRGLIG
ncbi:MAG TPA: hypothetical protein VH595_02930 [Verrucomicrobiae bacterium]|nr:hypothetical protein [Verrucomicrobiae bacterium]